jgi:hypothetical protein
MIAVDCLAALLVPETESEGSNVRTQRMAALLLIARALRATAAQANTG